jgi:hypothetical protein
MPPCWRSDGCWRLLSVLPIEARQPGFFCRFIVLYFPFLRLDWLDLSNVRLIVPAASRTRSAGMVCEDHHHCGVIW